MSIFTSLATIKPRGEAGVVDYAPQRDMAYNFINLLTEVFRSLDSQNWSPDVRAVLSEMQLTDEQIDEKLGHAVSCFATGLRSFLREPGITSPERL
jgi:hypothetical protein